MRKTLKYKKNKKNRKSTYRRKKNKTKSFLGNGFKEKTPFIYLDQNYGIQNPVPYIDPHD